MRRLLGILTVLTITQGTYAMEDDDRVAFKIQSIKVQQSLFESKSLEEQQQMLISALNVFYEAKRSAQLSICVRLGRPLAQYEGFDQTEKSFTPNACLQFSGKTLSVKDISREDLNPLINYLLNKSAIFSFKKKLSRNSNLATLQIFYGEEFKKNRHELLWNIHRVISDYYTVKERFKNHAMTEISNYSMLKEVFKNHPMVEKTSAFHEGMLECRLFRKNLTDNKEGKTQEALEKIEEFQKALNKEKKIKSIVKNSKILNLLCTKNSIKTPNKPCNPNCALTAFVDFSVEYLFKFYDMRCTKLYELNKINETYINHYGLFYLIPQNNISYLPQKASYAIEEKAFFNTEETIPYNTKENTPTPIVLPSAQPFTPTQERLRKKLQSQQGKAEEEKNNTVIKQKENSTKELKKDPPIPPSIDEILHNILGGDTPRDGHKKPYNQKKGKQGKGKNGGGQEEKSNLKKLDSSQQQPQKKETAPKKQPIHPSSIMVNMQGGGTAAIGASRPSDGQEEAFKPQFVKKPRQEEYGPLKEARKPTPKGKPQNKPQMKAQPTDPLPSSKSDLPGKLPYRVVITPSTFPRKDELNVQVPQNLTPPETNGDEEHKNLDKPTILSDEERNSDNLNSENLKPDDSICRNKDLTTSSEGPQSPPKIKQNLIATQESEVQNDKAPIGQAATPVLKQPSSPVIFPSKEYRIEDHPTIAKILIQNNVAHVYTHEREEAELVVTKYRAALESEKRAREVCDKEITELKQQIASHKEAGSSY